MSIFYPSPLISHCRCLSCEAPKRALSFYCPRIPHGYTASRAPSEHLLPFPLDFTLQNACLAKRRCEHSPPHFGIPHDHTASRAPSEYLLSFSLDFTLQECLSCEAPMRAFSSHHFRIPHDHTASRAPSEHLLLSSLISHSRMLVLRSAEASTHTNGHRATRM